MKGIKYFVFLLICVFFYVGCGTEDLPSSGKGEIELSYQVSNYAQTDIRSTNAGSEAEQQIDNLYVYLFPTSDTQTLYKFYIDASAFTYGSWNKIDQKIILQLSQSNVGNRNVYVVANCAGLKAQLDGVTTTNDLKSVLNTTNTPWSKSLTTPIIMVGNQTWDFSSNPKLNAISLIRTLAKVEVNITLPDFYKSKPKIEEGIAGSGTMVSVYKYRFVNFDQNMYVLKPDNKPDNTVTSSWTDWDAGSAVPPDYDVSAYTLDANGEVAQLRLLTYLNERDHAGSAIEITLPYKKGNYPPPQFGNDTYTLNLPAPIVRNTWYIYDIVIDEQ